MTTPHNARLPQGIVATLATPSSGNAAARRAGPIASPRAVLHVEGSVGISFLVGGSAVDAAAGGVTPAGRVPAGHSHIIDLGGHQYVSVTAASDDSVVVVEACI